MNIITTFAQATSDVSYYTNEEVSAAILNLIIILLPLFIFLSLFTYLVTAFFLGNIFRKAGLPWWKAWVPFYNIWKTFEIGGQYGALSLLFYLPFVQIVGAVFYGIATYHIGLKLGKPGAFVLFALFFPIVWFMWLAYDTSTWDEARSSAPSRAKETPPPTAKV